MLFLKFLKTGSLFLKAAFMREMKENILRVMLHLFCPFKTLSSLKQQFSHDMNDRLFVTKDKIQNVTFPIILSSITHLDDRCRSTRLSFVL